MNGLPKSYHNNWDNANIGNVNIISVYNEVSSFLCTLSFVTFVVIAFYVNRGKTMQNTVCFR